MFGYIRPEKPELKIREYEVFRAYYCGVCKSIGRNFGQLPRLTLNYDSTFLALLLSSVSQSEPKSCMERCLLHPANRRRVYRDDKAIDYAADINIILSYHSLKDKWDDDKLLISLPGMAALHLKYKKLKNKYSKLCSAVEENLSKLSTLEKEKCSSIDQAAEPFAALMAEVTGSGPVIEDENTVKILKWLGYNLGKWVYMIDAFHDIERDIKSNSYNPLIYQYKYTENENIADFKNRIKKDMEFTLTYSLNEISKAFELLDVKRNRGLVENIIYMGMLRQTELVLNNINCKGKRQN
ncbi:MAG TPA: hypothetical protein GXX49_08080 [Clostridiaceae bacterium]|nr:hypothetical protein [Clostridiaceae bacterium]